MELCESVTRFPLVVADRCPCARTPSTPHRSGSPRLTIAPIDFSHADELIRRGYEDSRDYLDLVESGDVPVPLPMSMHSHRHSRAIAA